LGPKIVIILDNASFQKRKDVLAGLKQKISAK